MPNLLDKITSQLKSFFGGTTRTVQEKTSDLGSFFNNFSQRNRGAEIKDTKTQPSPSPSVSPQPSPSMAPSQDTLQQQIDSGLQRFSQRAGSEVPIASLSAELAQAGRQLPQEINQPFLPTILALMESRGLLDSRPAQYANPYNVMAPDLVQYANPQQAILGGDGKLGLMGLLREGGPYQSFRETGNIADFFNTFTPSSDPLNPSNQDLVDRYNSLLSLFMQ